VLTLDDLKSNILEDVLTIWDLKKQLGEALAEIEKLKPKETKPDAAL
jgi:hypothetical protein